MFTQRCEKKIFAHIPKQDKHTLHNVQHVTDFCQVIHHSMLQREKKWDSDPGYMQN